MPFQIGPTAQFLARHAWASVGAAATMFLVPLLVLSLLPRWGTTPGKLLFQLRVVDRHGLRPPGATLALRSVFQLLPIWTTAINAVLRSIGAPWLASMLCAAVCLFLVLDAAAVIVGRGRRAIHDRLLGTRVVIDAGPGDRTTGEE